MIVRSVKAHSLRVNSRLDCKYFLSPGTQAAERLVVAAAAGVPLTRVGGPGGLGKVWMPGRDRKWYAAAGESGIPYLRAYDVFDYVPAAADWLSPNRSTNLDELIVPAGTIVQTRSGRNLGPGLAVDAYLAGFALSDDLIRIEIDDQQTRHFLLAFLASPTGQALVRRDKTGSVIDHLSVDHIAGVTIPMLDEAVRAHAAEEMAQAIMLREQARIILEAERSALADSLPPIKRAAAHKQGWAMRGKNLGSRLDAAVHDPVAQKLRKDLLKTGGVPLDDAAVVVKPAGRYKTYYVDADHGRPLLSGRQLLQFCPVNLQYLSARSVDPAKYELGAGQVAFQADGRSEERLGFPVMVEPGRDGWLASGHVGRLAAKNGVDPGWLYAAFATEQVQLQVKALACGSVVDALYPEDLNRVVLPAPGQVDGVAVLQAWAMFTEAAAHERRSIEAVEDDLAAITGERQLSA